MFRNLAILALLAVWMALPGQASAIGNWKPCADLATITSGATTTPPAIGPRTKFCYQFDNAAVAGSESTPIRTNALATQICFDPDQGSTGGAARVDIWSCPHGWTSTANRPNECISVLDAPLVGAGGSAATQTACTPQNHGPGLYVVVPTIAAGAGEEPVVTFSGLGE